MQLVRSVSHAISNSFRLIGWFEDATSYVEFELNPKTRKPNRNQKMLDQIMKTAKMAWYDRLRSLELVTTTRSSGRLTEILFVKKRV
jgi:hypothetical protein